MSCRFVIFGTVVIRTIIKGAVPSTDGSAPSLIHEMPIEAGKWSMLRTLMLQKQWTLLCAEFLQVPIRREVRKKTD